MKLMTTTIKQTATIPATPLEVYEALMASSIHWKDYYWIALKMHFSV